jgi:hypothetical protein
MEAEPECFPRAAKDRAPEAQRRGAERLNFCYAKVCAPISKHVRICCIAWLVVSAPTPRTEDNKERQPLLYCS